MENGWFIVGLSKKTCWFSSSQTISLPEGSVWDGTSLTTAMTLRWAPKIAFSFLISGWILWFMVYIVNITIVNRVYKPTYNWGAPSCSNHDIYLSNITLISSNGLCFWLVVWHIFWVWFHLAWDILGWWSPLTVYFSVMLKPPTSISILYI